MIITSNSELHCSEELLQFRQEFRYNKLHIKEYFHTILFKTRTYYITCSYKTIFPLKDFFYYEQTGYHVIHFMFTHFSYRWHLMEIFSLYYYTWSITMLTTFWNVYNMIYHWLSYNNSTYNGYEKKFLQNVWTRVNHWM